MLPRFFDPIEISYDTMFKNNPATLFTPYSDPVENPRFLRLLQQAMDRGTPVTRRELEEFFEADHFSGLVEWVAEDHFIEPSRIFDDLP